MSPSSPWTERQLEWLDHADVRRTALAVFVALLAVYGASATYRFPATVDVTNAVIPAYQLGVEHTLDVTDFEPYIQSRPVVEEQFVEVDGRWYSGRNIGVILTAAPVYLLSGVKRLPDALPPLWPGTVAAVVVTSGAMALLYLTFRRLVPGRQALAGALLAALGTTAWSTASDLLWSHGPAMLWLAAAVLALSRERDLLAGLAMGVAMTMRPELAVSAAVLGLWIAVESRSWSRLAVLAAGPILFAAILLVYNADVLGVLSPIAGHRNTKMLAAGPSLSPARMVSDAAAVLVEPRNGLLLFSPFLLVMVPGIPAAWRAAAPWIRGALLAGLAHLALIIVIQGNGDGNFFFGYRFPLEMLTLAAPFLVLVWREHVLRDRGWRVMFAALAVASVVINGAGAILELRR